MYRPLAPPPPKPLPPPPPPMPMVISTPRAPFVINDTKKGFIFMFLIVISVIIPIVLFIKQTGCPNVYLVSSEREMQVKHHRSDGSYESLIYYNNLDGNVFRYASDEGYKYVKIPEFSDELYTIDTKDFNNRTDYFKATINDVETGRRAALERDVEYTIKVFKPCWGGIKTVNVLGEYNSGNRYFSIYVDAGGGRILDLYKNGFNRFSIPLIHPRERVFEIVNVDLNPDVETEDITNGDGEVVEVREIHRIRFFVQDSDNETMKQVNDLDQGEFFVIMYRPKVYSAINNFSNNLIDSLKNLFK